MNEFRNMTNDEWKLVAKLLEYEFKGADELRAQLRTARVRDLDDDGCLEFMVENGPLADVSDRVPAEGYTTDVDGVRVHALLHVVHGKLNELEIYKDDNSPVLKKPTAETLHFAEWLHAGQ